MQNNWGWKRLVEIASPVQGQQKLIAQNCIHFGFEDFQYEGIRNLSGQPVPVLSAHFEGLGWSKEDVHSIKDC